MYNFKITDEPFARGYLSAETDSMHVRTGAAFLAAAKEMEISIYEDLGLPNAAFRDSASGYHFSLGETVDRLLLESKAEAAPAFSDDYRYIAEQIGKHNPQDLLNEAFTEKEKNIIRSFGGWGGTWGGHSVPNLLDFAKYGTRALREKVRYWQAQNPDVSDFYEGILLTLDALDILGDRFRSLAERLAQKNTGKAQRKLERLAKTFTRCPRLPAETFADACAVYVMVFTLDGIDSPGHFDWYMIDFWNRSDYAESREMLEDLWLFFQKTRTWNLCIGGSDEHWNDRSNALTYEILDVVLKYKFNTPNLTMRCHRNTPEKLWRAAMQTIAAGTGLPALYNDEAVCPALERLGIPAADAHAYVMNGCNQIDIQGKSHMGLEDGEVNLGMAIELAFFNGICQKTGCKIGADTGEAADFETFEDFYTAVRTQIFALCDAVCGMANKSQRIYARHTSNPIRSLTIDGCLEKGRDYKNGGPLYGHGQILLEGVPDAVDALAAVRRYVFEDHKFTMSELKNALRANFEGCEDLFRTLRTSRLHFGNDNPAVDDLAKRLLQDCGSYLLQKPTVRGGFYGAGCSPFVRAADNGGAVGALPNGKKAGENLYGDSIGATPGRDRNGPTALLNSCLAMDQTLPTSGFILNLKFDRKLMETQQGLNGLLMLCKTYFENRGQQLSVTVVSREDLLDAMEHPENHGDLIVRVGGFSDYFVNLSPALKENVLARTDHLF